MKLKRVTIIYNPKNGAKATQKLRALEAAFAARGVEVSAMATTREPNSAMHLARQEAAYKTANLVVAMGGDGTVRGVAEGLIHSGIPMSPYRGGTGDIFTSYWYPKLTPTEYVDMLLRGTPQPVDLLRWSCRDAATGEARHGIAIVAVGFGKLLDAIGDADPKLKKRFGKAAYAHDMAIAATDLQPVMADVTYAEQTRTDKLSMGLLMNVPPPQAPAISPGMSACDGMLDFVGLSAANFGQLLSAGVRLGLGRGHKSSHYWRCRVPSLVVKLERPVVINIDGDPGPTSDYVTVNTMPGAVKMVISP